MRSPSRISRRRALALGTLSATLPLVHIRTAGAAGKLSLGLEDHWVAAANTTMRKLIEQWAARNAVEVEIDFITSVGSKNLLTLAAESKSHTGHDVRSFVIWTVHQYADQLEPVDDIMQRLTGKYGPPARTCEYLAKIKGSWLAVPTAVMSKHMSSCARIDVFRQHCGIDLQAMYPARPEHTPQSEQWTWDTFLAAAQQCHAAGMPFGLAVSNNGDSVDWIGSLFAAFGAELVDAKGNITVKSDNTRQVLEYAQRLAKFLPPTVYGWDGQSNNRALISGQSALIFDAPSAWSVAKKDAPSVAAQCWGFPNPKGAHGRFVPYNTQYWGIWKFARNKSAARDLIEYLSQREQVEQTTTASSGYDIPPFASMSDFKVWETEQPPAGIWYNYPIKPFHHSQPSIAGYPAPPDIAVQIYNNALMPMMVARVAQSKSSIDETLAWAEGELETYSRG